MEFTRYLFSFVCGQHVEHTWAPGGVFLPCCQRCVGLYAGAFIAFLALNTLRPERTGGFLKVHGAFLLLMLPFGFHWLPQGPLLRSVTGGLFGFGVCTFLCLPLTRRFYARVDGLGAMCGSSSWRNWAYFSVAGLTGIALFLLGRFGGAISVFALSVMAVAGFGILGLLVLTDVFLGCIAAIQVLQHTRRCT